MIVGVGVDVMAVERMARGLERDRDGLRAQLFTTREIDDCEGPRSSPRRYAACFAAKEALLKTLAGRPQDLGVFREAEVRTAGGGAPIIGLRGRLESIARERGVTRIHLSLSHTRDLATALVILESDAPVPAERRGSRA